MKPMPGSCTAPRLSSTLSSWRIWSPTLSGLNPKSQTPNPKNPQNPNNPGPVILGFGIWGLGFDLYRYGNPLHREDFDHVADLDVVVVRQPDAALEARLHLADVVFEAAQ